MISRKTRPQTPDLIKQCNPYSYDEVDKAVLIDEKIMGSSQNLDYNKEKTIIVAKVSTIPNSHSKESIGTLVQYSTNYVYYSDTYH